MLDSDSHLFPKTNPISLPFPQNYPIPVCHSLSNTWGDDDTRPPCHNDAAVTEHRNHGTPAVPISMHISILPASLWSIKVVWCRVCVLMCGCLPATCLVSLGPINNGGSKHFERGGATYNVLAPSSYIANAHNELHEK